MKLMICYLLYADWSKNFRKELACILQFLVISKNSKMNFQKNNNVKG